MGVAMEYKIGDFSIVTRLTVKTLRYYDEVGILRPARTDPDSGYRWYDETSLERAAVVKKLRELDFSIGEIVDLVKEARDDADLDGALRRKARELDVKIERYAQLRSEIALAMTATRQGPLREGRKEPELVEVPVVQAATIRYTGWYNQLGPRLGLLFRLYGRHADGPPFVLYHDGEFKEEADLEVCLPLKPGVTARANSKEGTTVRPIPAARALEVIHVGPYEEIGNAYRQAFGLLQARGLEAVPP
jgi:DNA-binding transcriptional MerR regulator